MGDEGAFAESEREVLCSLVFSCCCGMAKEEEDWLEN